MNTEQANHDKIQTEIAKMLAETNKINRETWWYPVTIGIAFTLAIIAFTKLFL